MKSHACEFTSRDLLRLVVPPLLSLALFAVVMHLGARFNLLPAPRPALDAEHAILIHQAEAARSPQDAGVLLLGDSSCLMDVSARQLGEHLGQPALSLATFSFLDLNSHASMLREYTRVNPSRLRAVVLMLHPESLRRLGSEPYYSAVLTNYWSGRDHSRPDGFGGKISRMLGVDIFKGRLSTRVLPVPLNGAYARRYGFTRDLENHLTQERGSAIDPAVEPLTGNNEYRLAASLERASKNFRSAVPPGVKLLVGLTPAPEQFVGPRFPQVRAGLLDQWSKWLRADVVLTNLPATLPDDSFARVTHLKEGSVPEYTRRLADALEPHLR